MFYCAVIFYDCGQNHEYLRLFGLKFVFKKLLCIPAVLVALSILLDEYKILVGWTF